MAKSDKSKTNVTARAELKAQQAVCRFCGRKPEVIRVLTPTGRAQMYRKCCATAGIAA
ncbi:MAG TPA: hypothetical protein VFB21_17435 [Chthonomonadaceae bacterium]|jgi:hypothetical protein|nr:hypothetical protein [Chthonomonadaceae bacterium]